MAPRPGTKKYSDATRERALALAEESSAASAARELDIPVATIYAWRQAAGLAGPPTSERDPEAWAARKEEGARESWAEAKSALALVKERLEAGEENRAKTAALTFAILADKSAMLEQASALAQERNPKLSEAQGMLLAEVIRRTLADLGIRADAVASVVGHYLRQAQHGSQLEGPAPRAEEARRAVRRSIASEEAAPGEITRPATELVPLPPIEGEAQERLPNEARSPGDGPLVVVDGSRVRRDEPDG